MRTLPVWAIVLIVAIIAVVILALAGVISFGGSVGAFMLPTLFSAEHEGSAPAS